jgi:hypothetical protein
LFNFVIFTDENLDTQASSATPHVPLGAQLPWRTLYAARRADDIDSAKLARVNKRLSLPIKLSRHGNSAAKKGICK